MSLFVRKNFKSHTDLDLDFKIECDALDEWDLSTLAYMISEKYKFRYVIGIPKGGIRLAEALQKYINPKGDVLIVDDVLTTGNSMNNFKQHFPVDEAGNVIGVVIFARGPCPNWVDPIFMLWDE